MTEKFKPRKIGSNKLSLDERIANAIKVHGDAFDYSNWKVDTSRETGEVYCKKHDYYWNISYDNHVNKGKGCKFCKGDKITDRLSVPYDEANKRLNSRLPKLIIVEESYIRMSEPCEIICEEHGIFTSAPVNMMNQKYGCVKCSEDAGKITTRSLTREEFLDRVSHLSHIDWSESEYINQKTPVRFYCTVHKKYHEAKLNNLVFGGKGCDLCGKESSASKQLGWINYTTIEQYSDKYKNQSSNLYIFKLEDFKKPTYKIGIARSTATRLQKLREDFGKSTLILKRPINTYSAFYAEKYLHYLFKDFQVKFKEEDKMNSRGRRLRWYSEIFNLTEDHLDFVIDFIKSTTDNYTGGRNW